MGAVRGDSVLTCHLASLSPLSGSCCSALPAPSDVPACGWRLDEQWKVRAQGPLWGGGVSTTGDLGVSQKPPHSVPAAYNVNTL